MLVTLQLTAHEISNHMPPQYLIGQDFLAISEEVRLRRAWWELYTLLNLHRTFENRWQPWQPLFIKHDFITFITSICYIIGGYLLTNFEVSSINSSRFIWEIQKSPTLTLTAKLALTGLKGLKKMFLECKVWLCIWCFNVFLDQARYRPHLLTAVQTTKKEVH